MRTGENIAERGGYTSKLGSHPHARTFDRAARARKIFRSDENADSRERREKFAGGGAFRIFAPAIVKSEILT